MKPHFNQFCRSLFIFLLLVSCETGQVNYEEEVQAEQYYNNNTPKDVLEAPPDDGKLDGVNGPEGISAGFDNGSTQVWKVLNQWEDRNTSTAKKAGIDWCANSGLNWYQKYQAWVRNLPKIDSVSKTLRYSTYQLTTPWGKTLAAPALESTEAVLFLMVTFASWYNLPLMLVGYDGDKLLFFGHFGQIDANGKNFGPVYKTAFKDYSDQFSGQTNASIIGNWPHDKDLKLLSLDSSDNTQPALGGSLSVCSDDSVCPAGEGCQAGKCYLKAGAYLDEIFLNKRAGHLLARILMNFGVLHLASTRNTFNLKTSAISEGDLLVQLNMTSGSQHALTVKSVNEIQNDRVEVELLSGSDPRQQPLWMGAALAKPELTDTNAGCFEYSYFGGGLKRFRLAKKLNGQWINSVLSEDVNNFVVENSAAARGRCQEFESLLGTLSAEETDDLTAHQALADQQLRGYYCAGTWCIWDQNKSTFGKVREGNTKYHMGVDMYAVVGTPVKSMYSGIVTLVDPYNTGYGRQIVIECPVAELNGTTSTYYLRYAHLSEIAVTQGASVTKGQHLGKTGNTGNAAQLQKQENHLHLEFMKTLTPGSGQSGYKNRVNPAKYTTIADGLQPEQTGE